MGEKQRNFTLWLFIAQTGCDHDNISSDEIDDIFDDNEF